MCAFCGSRLLGMVAADSLENPDRAAELGIFNKSTVYRLHLERQSADEALWRCETGDEWNGTVAGFELREKNDFVVYSRRPGERDGSLHAG